MALRIHHLQRLQSLQSLARSQTPRTFSYTARYVHQSSRQNVSLPTSSPVTASSQILNTQTAPHEASTKAVLGRLPTSTVLRSYLITAMSSSPVLLSLCFGILRRMLDSKSYFMSVEHNPVLATLLKKTFYAQFCVGEQKEEVVRNSEFARNVLGYGGVYYEYALEVLAGGEATAEETKQEIEVWRKGMLKSVDMAMDGDFVGLKWSGLGRHALHLLQKQQDPTPEMLAAMTAACDAAAAKGVTLLPGAEEEITNIGIEKWTLALQKKYNAPEHGRALLYITYQCYLRGISQRMAQHLEIASKEGYIAGVKLVRGAYLTYEPKELTFDNKESTDANYDACLDAAVQQQWTDKIPSPSPNTPFPPVNIVLATHNLASVQRAKQIRASQMLTTAPEKLPRLTYAQLQGMADEISQSLVLDPTMKADKQAKVVKCMTWGTTTECLNFLLRRASENKEAALRTVDTRKAMGAELWRRTKGVFGLA
ncbi:FAD-linked oxidoreductase [Cucurbitaria berberidis CBS 394.84]|uniref:Proline dehydrogenase n=1 Tax=Cucurbitaria berberidis CBS 394.84 TaxID=1168544 RepID=A0A9P4GIB6_9PLEO|nr:FAD-linked oxidoreductase [Cucurbitaria berberidis CBS 394.84]KAF1846120.1 FAD-linked oxidoreductase [Cucurbitaria berberidis CBS 394.84]